MRWITYLAVACKRPIIFYNIFKLIFYKFFGKSALIKADGIFFRQHWGNGVGAWAAASGLSYDSEIRKALEILKPGDVVLDLGANVGVYTLQLAKKVGPTGLVIAVEANSEFYKVLSENIRINAFSNVLALHAAVGDGDEPLELTWNDPKANEGSVHYKVGRKKEIIRQIKMDVELNKLGLKKLNFVKMDIEGSEGNALNGLSESLKKYSPPILFENSHPAVIEKLKMMGYCVGLFEKIEFVENQIAENLWALRKV